ncbi:MAG TPA: hypothetical protein VHE81_08000 [Lacipirellulaceae bacterium]|nr:hypothetical protein [Lacipirellulaceae bacterium]
MKLDLIRVRATKRRGYVRKGDEEICPRPAEKFPPEAAPREAQQCELGRTAIGIIVGPAPDR